MSDFLRVAVGPQVIWGVSDQKQKKIKTTGAIMQRYRDTDNDSGVHSFEINNDSITVKFSGTARAYTYSYTSAGQHHIENMKRLALSGDGLNAYINKNVKHKFVR